MMTNQAGYSKAQDEYNLYDIILPFIQSMYYNILPQYVFDTGCKVDFFALDHKRQPVIIEVKNWFVSIKDMEQLIKYYVHATELFGENKFKLVVIAGGIEQPRRVILEKLGIQIIITKDLLK